MLFMFMQTIGRHFPVHYGSVIIMNVLFAMKMNAIVFVNISRSIHSNGIMTITIRTI